MKKEYLILGIVMVIYFITDLTDVQNNQVEFSETPFKDSLVIGFHGIFFIIFTYLLIPKLFYKNRFLLFTLFALLLIVTFSIIDEGIIEKILYPTTQGLDPITIQSPYWFFTEIAVPLLAFVTVKLLFDNFENRKRIIDIKNDSLQNELKFLKSQIQPHVLFNSLNNLYEYTLSKSDKAPDLVLGLSKVLRYVLYKTDTKYIALNEELQFLEEYIALQKSFLENRGEIDFSLNMRNAKNNLFIAPFILIPFVENSFKHSLNTMETGIEIKVDISIDSHILEMRVINNFKSFNKSSPKLISSGIGLQNVKKRLQLLYPDKHSLDIEDQKNLYVVSIVLNLEQ